MASDIARGRGSMEKPRPSVSTRTEEFTPRELPLAQKAPAARPLPDGASRRSERIRDALRRWFDEDL